MRRDLWAALLVAVFLGLVAARSRAASAAALDLNTATRNQLLELPGVGPKRAEEIIRYRLQRPFRRTADLMRVKGIGPKMFDKLKPLVSVTEGASGNVMLPPEPASTS